MELLSRLGTVEQVHIQYGTRGVFGSIRWRRFRTRNIPEMKIGGIDDRAVGENYSINLGLQGNNIYRFRSEQDEQRFLAATEYRRTGSHAMPGTAAERGRIPELDALTDSEFDMLLNSTRDSNAPLENGWFFGGLSRDRFAVRGTFAEFPANEQRHIASLMLPDSHALIIQARDLARAFALLVSGVATLITFAALHGLRGDLQDNSERLKNSLIGIVNLLAISPLLMHAVKTGIAGMTDSIHEGALLHEPSSQEYAAVQTLFAKLENAERAILAK